MLNRETLIKVIKSGHTILYLGNTLRFSFQIPTQKKMDQDATLIAEYVNSKDSTVDGLLDILIVISRRFGGDFVCPSEEYLATMYRASINKHERQKEIKILVTQDALDNFNSQCPLSV